MNEGIILYSYHAVILYFGVYYIPFNLFSGIIYLGIYIQQKSCGGGGGGCIAVMGGC